MKSIEAPAVEVETDLVRREIYRIKDEIGVEYKGDLKRLFSDLRRNQKKRTGHPIVNFSKAKGE
jgi:hypothetical protein